MRLLLHAAMSLARPFRLLFGSFAWPSGLLELGSYLHRRGVASVRILPITPGPPWKISPDLLARWEHEASPSPVRQAGDVTHPLKAMAELGEPFVKELLEFRPDIVGFRAEGWCFEQVVRCVQSLRILSETTVVIGGPSASSHPAEILERTGADYLFAGEAERSMAAFLEYARHPVSRQFCADMEGLAYRHAGQVYVNLPQQKPLPSFPQEEMRDTPLDVALMKEIAGPFDGIYLVGGRGCPGNCTFCARLHGQTVRTQTASQLIEAMEGMDRLTREGNLQIRRYPHFQAIEDPRLRNRHVGWACLYDEDFFLDRDRALEFFERFNRNRLKERYRLNLQTSPCSLVNARGELDGALMDWIGRLKPMLQLGGETFHETILQRWHKRHTVAQLEKVCGALDGYDLDYTVFQILTDYETTASELIDALRLLILSSHRHKKMRLAVTAWTLPLRHSEVCRSLLAKGLGGLPFDHFLKYEEGHPEWLAPEVGEIADFAEAHLEDCLNLSRRDSALASLFPMLLASLREKQYSEHGPVARWENLLPQVEWASGELAGLFDD